LTKGNWSNFVYNAFWNDNYWINICEWFVSDSFCSVVHQASTLMEFMSTYKDGQILIWVKQGSLSSSEKISNQLFSFLFYKLCVCVCVCVCQREREASIVRNLSSEIIQREHNKWDHERCKELILIIQSCMVETDHT
jgi:hypothetical protein